MRSTKPMVARWLVDPILNKVQEGIAAQNRYSRQQLDHLLLLQGQALAMANSDRAPFEKINEAEFKVFSQYGEDGILQYLIRETKIHPDEKIFIEFGVQDYIESNTRFLLQNNQWKGLIIDGSATYMESVRNSEIYWRNDLTAVDAWIDKDNINKLFTGAGFQGDIGVLSIDIDGNDYWVWEAIDSVNPVIGVVEWNSVFGSRHAVTVPYDPSFDRATAHHSCLFWGASMAAFELLGVRKGYTLLGSNQVGNNIFFVRKDRLGRLRGIQTQEAYVESRFRDSRDRSGSLNFLSGTDRYNEIKNLTVIDVISGHETTLAALDGQS
jgi:hypothetical protein